MSKIAVAVMTDRCKACHLCIANCPKDAVCPSGKVNAKGYEYVVVQTEKCIGCGSCYQMCPDYVFEIWDKGDK